MATLKSLTWLLRHHLSDFNNDNLHRIAISNLRDGERAIRRWWDRKYQPSRSFEDSTIEEHLIEMLEDFYERNPDDVGKFESQEEHWDGRMPEKYEKDIQSRLKKRRQIDLARYQDKAPLTEEEEKKILDSLGQNLPGSKDEFEDEFLGD
jgi:hypothetical protein